MMLVDLHTHTLASGHAYSTLMENMAIAAQKGLKLVGVSDHAPTMPGGPYIYHFQNLRVLPKEIYGVQVLKGVEANIIDHEGRIDMSAENLKSLDYVIASMHPPCFTPKSKKENTRALLQTMENSFVNIIGHPDDVRFELDYEEVVKGALRNGVLLEINNGSLNPKGYRKDACVATELILKLCRAYDHPIIMGSDAHIAFDVGNVAFCESLLAKVDFPADLILNSDVEKVKRYLTNKRK